MGGIMCLSATAMMAISTGMTVLGNLQKGQAEQEARNAQAQEQTRQAAQEEVAALEEAKRIRKAGERQASSARAALAGAGVDVGSGTAININEDIYSRSEMDAQQALLTGTRRSDALNRAAGRNIKAGENAVTASLLSSGSAALTGWKGVRDAKGK